MPRVLGTGKLKRGIFSTPRGRRRCAGPASACCHNSCCYDEMRRRGHHPEDSVHNAVSGSREWASGISRHAKVRFCSSQFKDSVQLRKRLIRVARNTARMFDEVTDDGTVVYGVIEAVDEVPSVLRDYGEEMYETRDGVFETAWWILVEERVRIGGMKSVIERYPDRGIIVRRT